MIRTVVRLVEAITSAAKGFNCRPESRVIVRIGGEGKPEHELENVSMRVGFGHPVMVIQLKEKPLDKPALG